jgi:hypothetical protein
VSPLGKLLTACRRALGRALLNAGAGFLPTALSAANGDERGLLEDPLECLVARHGAHRR